MSPAGSAQNQNNPSGSSVSVRQFGEVVHARLTHTLWVAPLGVGKSRRSVVGAVAGREVGGDSVEVANMRGNAFQRLCEPRAVGVVLAHQQFLSLFAQDSPCVSHAVRREKDDFLNGVPRRRCARGGCGDRCKCHAMNVPHTGQTSRGGLTYTYSSESSGSKYGITTLAEPVGASWCDRENSTRSLNTR